jgi:hypothetical protein
MQTHELSNLPAVFPSETSRRVTTARQLHLWCARLRAVDGSSPLPLRDLRRWSWRVLACVAAIDVASTERQHNALVRQVRDRLRRAAAALLALSDLQLVDPTLADFGRRLISGVDELLSPATGYRGRPDGWLDDAAALPDTTPADAAQTDVHPDGASVLVPDDEPRPSGGQDADGQAQTARAKVPLELRPRRGAQVRDVSDATP